MTAYTKAIATYTKPQQWKKEESERLRGERNEGKFNDLRIERWQVVGFRKASCLDTFLTERT